MNASEQIGAVVLAAGLSTRMGQPKMVLPWKGTTVLGAVVRALRTGGAAEIVVVTGGARELVEPAAQAEGARTAFNPDFANGEMLLSLQTGLRALPESVNGALVALGDQPRIQVDTVEKVLAAGRSQPGRLVVPSYQMRRGHPWLAPRALWDELLAMQPPAILRDFNHAHADEILYVEVDTDSVLQDLDTPEDYEREKGRGS